MGSTEVLTSYPTAPSLSKLTAADYHRPRARANAATESLGKPHVDSFNFMLHEGLRQVNHVYLLCMARSQSSFDSI